MSVPEFDLAFALRHALRSNEIVTHEIALQEHFNIDDEDEMLTEAGKSSRGDEFIIIRGREISFADFARVYEDYDTYDTYERALSALGVDISAYGSDSKKRQQSMRKDLAQAAAHYRKNGFRDFSVPKDRQAVYSKRYQDAVRKGHAQSTEQQVDQDGNPVAVGGGGSDGSRPTMDSINSGKGQRPSGKTTQIIQKVNDNAAIFVGEFYNNQSRIPPSRWASWLKFWDREKTRVAPDKALLGRNWKKSFVLGYQLEGNSLYEIWYNSMDSSFSVHDIRGIEVTRRAESMTEIMNNFVRFLRQKSPEDREMFMASNSALAKSLARSMVHGLEGDQRMQTMIRLSKEDSARERKARMDQAKSAREQKARFKAGVDSVKDNIKDAGRQFVSGASKMADEFGDAMADQVSRGSENVRKNRQTFNHDEEWSTDTARKQEPKTGTVQGSEPVPYDAKRSKATKETILAKFKRGVQDPDDITDGEYKDDVAGDEKAMKKRREEILRRLRQEREQVDKDNEPRNEDEYNENFNVFGQEMINEQMIVENDELLKRMEDALRHETEQAGYEQRIAAMRAQAQQQKPKQQLTVARLKREVTDELIHPYNTTRVEKSWIDSGFFRSMFKGRSGKIRLPTDKPNFVSRAMMSVSGTRHQADFVVGFTLSDRVNIEIWYVTEPNPDYNWSLTDLVSADRTGQRTISTYYVYDVSAKKLISPYQPYLRSAFQVAMSKLGSY